MIGRWFFLGMYTGIRFKGIVKLEFRKEIIGIAMFGEWENTKPDFFREFGKLERSSFIPRGGLSYMPSEWEEGTFPNQRATDGFNKTYDEHTGYWSFQCSLKNYESEIEKFFEIIPKFIEKIEHLEYYYEEWKFSERYDIVDGKVKMVDGQFIRYR